MESRMRLGRGYGAAKHAHAHSFIKRMPNGYDTVISEGGEYSRTEAASLHCKGYADAPGYVDPG